jgi:hypothetical protein
MYKRFFGNSGTVVTIDIGERQVCAKVIRTGGSPNGLSWNFMGNYVQLEHFPKAEVF